MSASHSERARASGDPLAGLRSKLQRMSAVCGLEALQQLLASCGHRALTGTPWQAAVVHAAAGMEGSTAGGTAGSTGGTGGIFGSTAGPGSSSNSPGSSAKLPAVLSPTRAAAAAAAAAVAAAGGSVAVGGTGTLVPQVVSHVMDLLSWVDFFSGDDIASGEMAWGACDSGLR